jgi:hypothetical protein
MHSLRNSASVPACHPLDPLPTIWRGVAGACHCQGDSCDMSRSRPAFLDVKKSQSVPEESL